MERLVVGEVLKPQGIRGEIKIKTFTDEHTAIKEIRRVFIGGTEYKVLSFRKGEAGIAYLGLRGVPDRNAAELLRGKSVEAERADVPPLEEGTYYIVDLLGCEVYTDAGEKLGVLKDVASLSSDIYTVKDGEKELRFPAVRGVVKSVDTAAKKIVLDAAVLSEIGV
ncbi:MAG: ribosome maturation factor RimM [Candidatus Scatosoma sp.]